MASLENESVPCVRDWFEYSRSLLVAEGLSGLDEIVCNQSEGQRTTGLTWLMFVSIDFLQEKFLFSEKRSTFELQPFDFAIATLNFHLIRDRHHGGSDRFMHSRHRLRRNNDFRNVQWFQWFISLIIGLRARHTKRRFRGQGTWTTWMRERRGWDRIEHGDRSTSTGIKLSQRMNDFHWHKIKARGWMRSCGDGLFQLHSMFVETTFFRRTRRREMRPRREWWRRRWRRRRRSSKVSTRIDRTRSLLMRICMCRV